MADSENSRFLPLKTRRSIISTGVISAIVMTTKHTHGGADDISPDNDEAVLGLWQRWYSVHRRRCKLTALQQRLETQLLIIAEEPVLTLHIPGRQKPVLVSSVEEIERTLWGMEVAEVRNQAIAKFRSLQQEWDLTAWELGYTQACEEEVKADRLEWELAETLWSSSANSLDGVAAKLHALVEMGDSGIFIEASQPALRSILADLIRINP